VVFIVGGTFATIDYGFATGHFTVSTGYFSRTSDQATYDAWGRLVQVNLVSNNSLVATYRYDAQNHRITKTVGSTTTDYYYNQQWQVVEEQAPSGAATAVTEYVWDASYIDTPIVRYQRTIAQARTAP
jgi:hypothetical protein